MRGNSKGRRWHYLTVKNYWYYQEGECLNITRFLLSKFFHSFRTKKKIQSHRDICKNKDFSSIIMPPEDTKILEFNQYQKTDQASFSIYADL